MKLYILGALIAVATACTDSGSPTGSTCPTTDPPTYATFGQTFMTTYCTSCHSANSTNRHDAPNDMNFDTEADVIAHADDIDTWSAAGPNATNTQMPDIGGTVTHTPTQAEREMLGQFLACETP
jgi:uncharacterized membrane protein